MYYNWKSKCGGVSASDLKRLKEMERELSQLKRMYADMAMENRALKDLIEKNSKAAREARRGDLSGGRSPAVTSRRLIRVFECLRLERGLPDILRVDNGPQFLSGEFVAWQE
jgi:hypothetical protein